MAAEGYGALDKVSKSGDTMTGPLTLDGSPPLIVPGGTAGEILQSDASGHITLQPGGTLVLDSAAGDMQPLGTAAAGSKGQGADAKHVHPSSSATAFTSGVVALTDAATIAVNAAAGNHFRVTLGGNRTLGNPSNPVDGQKITFEIIQDSVGSRTLSYGTAYAFGSSVPQPVLTTTAAKRDVLAFLYNAAIGKWLCVGFLAGY